MYYLVARPLLAAMFFNSLSKLTPHRALGSDIVTIYVGKERTKFSLHRQLLCSKVPYFDKAFNGGFAEASKQEMHLPEDSAKAFVMFTAWLYGLGERWTIEEFAHDDMNTLIELYLFSDAKCCDDLKDFTMDIIQDATAQDHLKIQHIEKILAETTISDTMPIRMFCMAHINHQLHYKLDDPRPRLSIADISDIFTRFPESLKDMLYWQKHAGIYGIQANIAPLRSESALHHLCRFHVHAADDVGRCGSSHYSALYPD